jgi:hypothetical protein
VVAEDDEALVTALTAHVDESHPDDARTDDERRALVEAEAYEPPDRPPWAY